MTDPAKEGRMKQFRFAAAFVLGLTALAAALGGGGDDLTAMQGVWAATITEREALPLSKDFFKITNLGTKLTIGGRTFDVYGEPRTIRVRQDGSVH